MKKDKLSLSIIAGRDQGNLDRLIGTINSLTEFPDEIIIIFDMNQLSKMPLVEIKNKVIDLKLMEYHGIGKQPHMRNIALSLTTCNYIWFIDDDTSLHPSSCSELYRSLSDISLEPKIASIAGRIIENKEFDIHKLKRPICFEMVKGPIGLFELKENEFPYSKYESCTGISKKKYPIIDFCQGTSMVFCVDKLKEVGGFDESLGIGYSSFEDSEPSFALKRKGYYTVYDPSFELIHHKLPRIGGADRSNQQIDYNQMLIRNCTISLLNNDFPSKNKKYIYILFFYLVQSVRCIRENLPWSSNKLGVIFKIIKSLSKGLMMGVKVSRGNNYSRVNTSDS